MSTDWHQFAACGGNETDLFFPVGKKADEVNLYELQVGRAKEVCRPCPVKDDCLREAVSKGYDFGVWGGTTEELRRWLRKPKPGQTVKPPPSPLLGRRQCTRETARQGQDAIRAGMSVKDAAATFDVTVDTARRWRKALLEESEVAV